MHANDEVKNNFQDTQYFSDSEHHLMSGGLASQHRQEMRRLRNRTLTGLETMRLVEQLRPGSATGIRPITPSFNNDKDMLMAQQFIDFNPAGLRWHATFCIFTAYKNGPKSCASLLWKAQVTTLPDIVIILELILWYFTLLATKMFYLGQKNSEIKAAADAIVLQKLK